VAVGKFRHDIEKYVEAIEAYKMALDADPDNAEAHYYLGKAYHDKGMYDEAIREYKNALQIDPDNAEARNALGLGRWTFGGSIGTSPPVDTLNEYLSQKFPSEAHAPGSKFEFNPGMTTGVWVGRRVSSRFGVRVELGSFSSKTSGTLYDDYVDDWGHLWEQYIDKNWKLTVRPVIFFGTLKLSPAYVGMGVGVFPTKLKVDWEREEYVDGFLWDTAPGSDSESDSPTGLVLLAGFQFGGTRTSLNLEVRYIFGAKAKLKDFGAEVDLSGFQLVGGAGFKF